MRAVTSEMQMRTDFDLLEAHSRRPVVRCVHSLADVDHRQFRPGDIDIRHDVGDVDDFLSRISRSLRGDQLKCMLWRHFPRMSTLHLWVSQNETTLF